MTHTKVLTHALLAGFALLNIATVSKANAEPITVNRGPNGAAFIVDSDHVPLDAKIQPQTPSHSFPEVMIRGPHGAAHLSQMATKKMDNPNASATPEQTLQQPRDTTTIAP